MATTMVHSLTTKAVDLVLALLLLIGSVTGAQIGARMSMKFRPAYLRIFLAIVVLIVAIRMALGLGWRPDEIYTVHVQRSEERRVGKEGVRTSRFRWTPC